MGLLRFLLAFAVIAHHSNGFYGYKYLNPVLAIQAFFVISGFYMTLILKEKYIGKNSNKIFYSNRFLRIFPTYWLILLFAVGASYLFYFSDNNSLFLGHFMDGSSLLYSDLSMIIRDFTVLFRADLLEINPINNRIMTISPAWTLVLELCFYAIAPHIVRKPKLIVLFLFLSIFIRITVYHFALTHDFPLTNRFFPAELMYFLLGSISYYIYSFVKRMNLKKRYEKIFVLLSIFLITMTVMYEYFPSYVFRWMNLGYVIFILLIALLIPFIFMISNNKFDRFIGDLSFPVYLIHTVVIALLTNLFILDISNKYFSSAVLIISVIFSALIVLFFEAPIDKWRQRRVLQN